MAILYRHIRLDKNVPFYIGIGKRESRAYSRAYRNTHWKGIVNKYGYEVEIIMTGLTLEEAYEKEREFIKLYGRADLGQGTLCNLTDGGEGFINLSPEAKERIRLASKNKIVSEETRKRISVAKKGSPGYWTGKSRSEETKRKVKENNAKGMSRKVIDTSTGVVYPSVQTVADMIGMRQGTLAKYLRGTRTNKTTYEFYQNKNNEDQCQ
jgi:hypothetical protein